MAQRWTQPRRRTARHLLGALVIVAISVIAASCAPAAPAATATPGTSPTPAPLASTAATATPGAVATAGVLTLVTPAANAVVTQNDPALKTACTASATRGLGYDIEFSWTVPTGLATLSGFQLVMQHGSSTPIVLDLDGATTTSFSNLSCNTFVIDNNLSGWHWQVNAIGNGKQVLVTSERRAFSFGPCRLANGSPCNATV